MRNREPESAPGEASAEPAGLTYLRAVVARCYPLHKGLLGLAANVAIVTLGTILVVLSLFLLKRPAAMQAGMWGQVFLQGFPVTFLVNLAGGAFYGEQFPMLARSGVGKCLMILLGELAMRAVLYLLLTAVSMMSWALVKGSFGGDPNTALASVWVTVQYGLRFQGLAGVYIYSMVLAAFPFVALLLIRLVTAARAR